MSPANMNFLQVISFAMWTVTALSAFMVIMMWPIRRQPGGLEMLTMLVGALVWNIAAVMKLHTASLSVKIALTSLGYAGICTVILYTFFLGYAFSSRGNKVPPWLKLTVSVVPLLTIIMATTNNLHGWMWQDITLNAYGIAIFERNWWYWIWFVYAYLTLGAATILFIRAIIIRRGIYRNQAIIMLLAVIPPWFVNSQFVLRFGGAVIPGVDFTSVTLGISLIVISLNYHLFHFLRSMPVAREKVMDSMNEGVLILDTEFQVLDANQTFCDLTGLALADIQDNDVFEVFSQYQQQLESILDQSGVQQHELYFDGMGYFDIHVSSLDQRETLFPGWLVLVYDLSPRRLAQQQLREAHVQLQRKAVELEQAQNTIKSIGDLIPICAWCGKRIELEDGSWIDVEEFITDYSDAKLTHGLCPECAAKS